MGNTYYVSEIGTDDGTYCLVQFGVFARQALEAKIEYLNNFDDVLSVKVFTFEHLARIETGLHVTTLGSLIAQLGTSRVTIELIEAI